jgi:hypothetical protein
VSAATQSKLDPRLSPAERIRALTDAARRLYQHPDLDFRLAGCCLASLLSGDSDSIAEFVGFSTTRGHRASNRARRAMRDDLLREAALAHFDGDPRPLAVALARYSTDCWPRDRAKVEDPYPDGSLKSMLWLAMQSWPIVPAERQIRRIIIRS